MWVRYEQVKCGATGQGSRAGQNRQWVVQHGILCTLLSQVGPTCPAARQWWGGKSNLAGIGRLCLKGAAVCFYGQAGGAFGTTGIDTMFMAALPLTVSLGLGSTGPKWPKMAGWPKTAHDVGVLHSLPVQQCQGRHAKACQCESQICQPDIRNSNPNHVETPDEQRKVCLKQTQWALGSSWWYPRFRQKAVGESSVCTFCPSISGSLKRLD